MRVPVLSESPDGMLRALAYQSDILYRQLPGNRQAIRSHCIRDAMNNDDYTRRRLYGNEMGPRRGERMVGWLDLLHRPVVPVVKNGLRPRCR